MNRNLSKLLLLIVKILAFPPLVLVDFPEEEDDQLDS